MQHTEFMHVVCSLSATADIRRTRFTRTNIRLTVMWSTFLQERADPWWGHNFNVSVAGRSRRVAGLSAEKVVVGQNVEPNSANRNNTTTLFKQDTNLRVLLHSSSPRPCRGLRGLPAKPQRAGCPFKKQRGTEESRGRSNWVSFGTETSLAELRFKSNTPVARCFAAVFPVGWFV